MAFTAGQCFLFPLGEYETAHLWVIATEPNQDGQFAIVSFTSLKGSKDQTVVLRNGEHPFIKHDTCVSYSAADITDSSVLANLLSCGEARLHSNLTADLLRLVQDGFSASDFTKKRIVEFIKKHR